MGFTEKTQHVPSPLRGLDGKELCTKHIPRRDTHIHTHEISFVHVLRRMGGYSSRGTVRRRTITTDGQLGELSIERQANIVQAARTNADGFIALLGGMGMEDLEPGHWDACISHFGVSGVFFSYVYTLPRHSPHPHHRARGLSVRLSRLTATRIHAL